MRHLLIVVVLVVALKLLVLWLEPRIAFYPIRGIQATPDALSLSYADLRIQTEDGETLHAWWLEHPHPRGQVLFFHGNGGNLSLWLDVIAELRRRGFSVLAVDYRGYGASTGSSTERGLYRDAKATVQAFVRRYRRSDVPVIYWGRSIGCPVAASAIAIERPDAVVLESPMPDARSVLRINPLLWVLSLFSSYRFSTSRHLAGYRGPLLVIHGDNDSIVPFAMGRRVFDAAAATPKSFVAIAGADHNDLHVVNPGVYWTAVDAFVATLTTAPDRRH
jgi:fermentation-respiration switch protein FrsA (DUF1100 family)